MNCDDVRAALLAGETTAACDSHIEGCVDCRRSVEEIAAIRADLASSSVWAEPPAGLEDSIVVAITGADVSSAELADRRDNASQSSGRLGRRSLVVMVGSIAAAFVLLLGGFAALNRTPPPDWNAAMVGPAVTPLATGTVAGWNMESGTRVLLEAGDLGVAPEGYVYQLWFTSGSTNISAGTFSDPTRVELTVGVSRKDFPAVWISLQPIGADSTTPGEPLLFTTDT